MTILPRSLPGPVLAFAVVAALSGCAGRVETTYESPGFARADLVAGRLGVGGVVLSARLAADPALLPPDGVPPADVLAQADAWAPILYGQLLAAGPDVPVWAWPAVRDACPDSVLVQALAGFARGGVLQPDQLAPLADALDEIRFLALARIDGDESSLQEGVGAAVENQRAKDGRDLHGNPVDRSLKTRRKVTVTLDVYDLAAGRSVWTTTAERQRDELYNFVDASADSRPPVVEPGEPVITAGGQPLPTAEFTRVFTDACGALAQRLLTARAP